MTTHIETAMTTANVRRYVVVTEERYDRKVWRSEFFVGVDSADPATALFREGDYTDSPQFETPDDAASAALRRGVEFASSLPDPDVIGLLTLHS
ncbi:hypothetical protein BZM27_39850 [Paraburkholderia steynii]|uniref:Uncharacterized protein n=1 Tax=Paraburkholderia steynii TaxID=1245441 RepID=A0A4R0XEY7_9BURK|nr:hypothetical protein BZM27_39850 [Paraburkholderia steynii]